MNTIGSDECRQKIHDFQRGLLERKAEILPLVKWYTIGKGYEFEIGLEAAYEYAVLEYSFSFWQWGNDCSKIPNKKVSTDELLEHLINIVGFSLYSDAGVAFYEPHFYQAVNEVGYYGFETEGFEDLLQVVKKPSNTIFAPKGTVEEFNPKLINKIHKWLVNKGDRIVYIYGALDTWSATALVPSSKIDALQIMMQNRSHGDARIKNMSEKDKMEMKNKLETWLGMKIPQF